MLEQMDFTESSWPGPGFMEPMFPSAPAPAPTPSSMPMDESRPSSKPKAKKKKAAKKKAAKKKAAKKKSRPRPRRRNRRRRKRPVKRNAAANRSRYNTRGSVSSRRSRGHVREDNRASCVVRRSRFPDPRCSAPKIPLGNPPEEVAAMLQRSASDWNRGDLPGFMSDYARDSLTSYMAAVTSCMAGRRCTTGMKRTTSRPANRATRFPLMSCTCAS